MVGAMTQTADPCAEASPWSAREAELLAVTLRLLQEHGYDQLTIDAVASAAHASKATVYRRWPSKAELVLAAFIEGVRQVAVTPNTGTLRGDLLQLGETCGQHGLERVAEDLAMQDVWNRNGDDHLAWDSTPNNNQTRITVPRPLPSLPKRAGVAQFDRVHWSAVADCKQPIACDWCGQGSCNGERHARAWQSDESP